MSFITSVFRKSGEYWVALCLENGVVGQGLTKDDALDKLKEAIQSLELALTDASSLFTTPISIKELHEFLAVAGHEPTLKEQDGEIVAAHDGYKRIGAVHWRTFRFADNRIQIADSVESRKVRQCYAYLHFAPGVAVGLHEKTMHVGRAMITVAGADSIDIEPYEYAPEFNRTFPALMAVIPFSHSLETSITF